MPTVTLVKPARFISRSVSGGRSSMRLSIENLDLAGGSRADLLDRGGRSARDSARRADRGT